MENLNQEGKPTSLSTDTGAKIAPTDADTSVAYDPKEVPPEADVPKEIPSEEVPPKEGGADPTMTAEQRNEAIAKLESEIRFPSCRLIFVIFGFWGFMMVYSLRVNISVPVVAMSNKTYVKNHSTVSISEEDKCEGGNKTKKKETFPGTYDFSGKDHGLITGAFFWGYLVLQIAGGTLAQKYGGKTILAGTMIFACIFTLLTPVCAHLGLRAGLIAIRFLTGLAEGCSYPSMHVLITQWAVPKERSKMVTFIYAGSKVGVMATSPLAGVLCDTLRWESVFYVTGGIATLWCLLFAFLIYDSPSQHPRISPEEKQYIRLSVGEKPARPTLHVPWLEILKSPPVYALIVAHFVYNWSNFTFLVSLPQYLGYILNYNIKENGAIAGLPYFVMWLLMVLTGVACDYLITHNIMSVTNVRKFMISFSFFTSGAFLLGVGFVKCNNTLAVALFTLSVGLTGVSWGGWSVNQMDLAPPYAGTLMGITNGLSTIAGIAGPYVLAEFIDKNQTRAGWRTFFYITGGINIFGIIVYCAFGSGNRQKWGYEPAITETDKAKESK